jgi:hypothetical protein
VIRRQRHIRLSLAAVVAATAGLGLESIPNLARRVRARRSLRRDIKALELVPLAFLADARKALVALEFAEAAKNVPIRLLSTDRAVLIDVVPEFFFGNDRAWDTVPFRPKALQNPRVDLSVGRRRLDEITRRRLQPLRTCCRGMRSLLGRWQQESFACSGASQEVVVL